jgi:hypothetical protein
VPRFSVKQSTQAGELFIARQSGCSQGAAHLLLVVPISLSLSLLICVAVAYTPF